MKIPNHFDNLKKIKKMILMSAKKIQENSKQFVCTADR